MDNAEFVDMLKIVVVNYCIEGVKQNITAPAGRAPQQKYIIMSSFYNSLKTTDKAFVDLIIKEAVDAAVFEFLCILDGVVSIENEKKGKLKLYYESDSQKILINDEQKEYLHDIFNAV